MERKKFGKSFYVVERKALRIDDINHEHRCTCTTCNDEWEEQS